MFAHRRPLRAFAADKLMMAAALLLMAVTPSLLAIAAAKSADGYRVTIDQFAFEPAELSVAAGTRVSWVNDDEAPHTVVTDDKSIRSGAIDTGDRFQYVFTLPGTYSYHCSLHPQMTGKIVVH